MIDDPQQSLTLAAPTAEEPELTPAQRQVRECLAQLRAALTSAPTPAPVSGPALNVAATAGGAQTAPPSLSWSNSQQNTFDDCQRARYYASELAPQGWRTDASAVARTAMRLKSLTGLDLAVGNTLHERASECAAAARDGEPLPRLVHLRQRASAYVRYVWTSSVQRYDQWLRYPRQVPMLAERYYGRGLTPERGAQVRERMERGLVALHDLGLWAELGACDPGTVHMPKKSTKYTLPDPLGVEPVCVWAVPDLVFQLPEGEWVVVDFKSGRVADTRSYHRARAQVVGYAAWLRHGLGVLGPDEGCQGRLILLSDGTEDEWWITPSDIDAAEDQIRQGARAMAAARTHADAAEQAAVADARAEGVTGDAVAERIQLARRGAYPMTRNLDRCRYCSYLELCAPERAREGASDARTMTEGAR